MTSYNWSNLSDHDFERVCRDILAEMLGAQVELFSRGRDGGIDLRAHEAGGLVIGQCKHFLGSTYSALVTACRNEAEKLTAMRVKPVRYFLFTSVALNVKRKAEICDVLSPHCLSPSDVLGLEDIEAEIRDHPGIEKQNYKLWLASLAVIERLLGSAMLSRTDMRVDQILANSRLYVPHASLAEAERILRDRKCLIVSGPPGIGKTTMADMLSLSFIHEEFDVRFVATVEEIEAAVTLNTKQLFVYDDFLGRTNLSGAPSATDQDRLIATMDYYSKKRGTYFILTTREYILRQAQNVNDRLNDAAIDLRKCILDVSGYDLFKRAQILYNHLYFAHGIRQEDIEQFIAEEGYWDVIDHSNFNPRWISDTLIRLEALTAGSAE